MKLMHQIIPRLARRDRKERAEGEAAEFTIKPAYEIQETNEAWGITVHLPGVTKDGLDITAEEDVLVIRGRRDWRVPEGWSAIYRESVEAPFELVLEHDNAIELDKVHAELKDGVLRVSLPKAEAIKPRKIAVS